MTEELEFFINEIRYLQYEPYTDPRHHYQNEKQTAYWEFIGDGACDYEERFPDAQPEIISDYIKHCEEQIKLGKKYLKEVRGM